MGRALLSKHAHEVTKNLGFFYLVNYRRKRPLKTLRCTALLLAARTGTCRGVANTERSGGHRWDARAKDAKSEQSRPAGAGGGDDTGRAVQPVRRPLCHREPTGGLKNVAFDEITSLELKGEVGAGELLSIQPHLRNGHQRLDPDDCRTACGQTSACTARRSPNCSVTSGAGW